MQLVVSFLECNRYSEDSSLPAGSNKSYSSCSWFLLATCWNLVAFHSHSMKFRKINSPMYRRKARSTMVGILVGKCVWARRTLGRYCRFVGVEKTNNTHVTCVIKQTVSQWPVLASWSPAWTAAMWTSTVATHQIWPFYDI